MASIYESFYTLNNPCQIELFKGKENGKTIMRASTSNTLNY